MPRTYQLRRRAETQRETRRRILDAAIELHATVGPARTTITAVAERAGVQRHTVYRHFPTEEDLLGACSAAWDERNPYPDAGAWARIADPEERLRTALTEVYGWFRRVAPDLAAFLRDADHVPALRRILEEDARAQEPVRDLLVRGWGARGRRRALLRAAVAHSLAFPAWRSLALDGGLDDEAVAELMVGLVRSAAGR